MPRVFPKASSCLSQTLFRGHAIEAVTTMFRQQNYSFLNPFALLWHSHLFSVINTQSVGTRQLVKCLLSGISISWEAPAVVPIETFLHSVNFQY